jgi:hypothetical protein
MPVETRWYRYETTTINGLTAYKLALAKIGTSYIFARTVTRYVAGGYICIDVAVRHADGTETAVASKVAQIQTTAGDFELTLSATVDIPETSLSPTDAIVVRVYWRFGDETAWTLCATFITEQLGASKLDAATWTCYYTESHTATLVPTPRSAMNFHIDGTYLSRIENFTWTPYVPPAIGIPRFIGDGLAGAVITV